MRSLFLLAALIAATPAAARDKEPPAGRVTGPAVSCVQIRNIRDTDRVDDRTIIFRMTNRRYYRNTLPQKCPQLSSPFTSFSYRVSGSQLCSVDVIHLLDRAGGQLRDFGSCGLGKFEPWEPEKRPKR